MLHAVNGLSSANAGNTDSSDNAGNSSSAYNTPYSVDSKVKLGLIKVIGALAGMPPSEAYVREYR